MYSPGTLGSFVSNPCHKSSNIRFCVSIWSLILLSVWSMGCNPATTGEQANSDASSSVASADAGSGLSSWADGPKTRIEDWVKDVTDSSSPNYIPVSDRIAVFDNDGTLWSEQPVPFQALFAMDQLKAMAPTHPEFQKDPILKGIIEGDMAPLKKAGVPGLLKMVYASHAGITEDSFRMNVKSWIDTAHDKRFGKLYKENIYQPMLELLHYLRANQFKTFIVSGGGADFMRTWTEDVYGIPPYQVVGTYNDAKYEVKDGQPVITKGAGNLYIDDKEGKPVAIHRFIGKVPVFCGGNSDGDQAMMQYTSGSKYKSMCVILHHTDSTREYAYDLHTLSGHLEKALEEAKQKNWLVIDMKNDFKKIYPFQ